jgi:hypothetical protein
MPRRFGKTYQPYKIKYTHLESIKRTEIPSKMIVNTVAAISSTEKQEEEDTPVALALEIKTSDDTGSSLSFKEMLQYAKENEINRFEPLFLLARKIFRRAFNNMKDADIEDSGICLSFTFKPETNEIVLIPWEAATKKQSEACKSFLLGHLHSIEAEMELERICAEELQRVGNDYPPVCKIDIRGSFSPCFGEIDRQEFFKWTRLSFRFILYDTVPQRSVCIIL